MLPALAMLSSLGAMVLTLVLLVACAPNSSAQQSRFLARLAWIEGCGGAAALLGACLAVSRDEGALATLLGILPVPLSCAVVLTLHRRTA